MLILKRRGVPILGVIPEVQLEVDSDKHTTWPAYAVTLRARIGCPVVVLVITPHAWVARWARRPIGLGPGNTFTAVVLGPEDVPAITDPEAARADPLAAVLGALTHARGPRAKEAARAAFRGLDALDDPALWVYCDMILKSVSPADRRGLHAMLSREDYKPQSKFFRDLMAKGIAEGRKIGLEEGRKEGREEGREEGLQVGEREALVKALRKLLAKRKLELRPTHEARLAKANAAQLTRWILKAADARRITDVFPPRR